MGWVGRLGRWAGGRRWVLWVLIPVTLLVVLPAWPGRRNLDTDSMIFQAQRNRRNDLYAPVVQWLLDPFLAHEPGMWLLYVGQFLVFSLAVIAIARLAGLGRAAAGIVAGVLLVNPIFVSETISVSRDSWFAAGTLAVVVAAFHPRLLGRARWVVIACGAFLVVGTRQNAVFAVAALLFVAVHEVCAGRRLRTLSSLVVTVAACLAALVGLQLCERALRVGQVSPEVGTMMPDLDEMSTRVGEVLLPQSIARRPLTLDYLATTSHYRLHQMFYIDKAVPLRPNAAGQEAVKAAWRRAVREHPWVWVATRQHLFNRQIGVSGPTFEAYTPETGTSFTRERPTFPTASRYVSNYLQRWVVDGQWWVGGWVHRAWWWLVLAWIAAAVRRQRLHVTLALMATAHLIGLWLTATSVIYRFVELSIILCQISVALAVAPYVSQAYRRWRGRRGSSSSPAAPFVG